MKCGAKRRAAANTCGFVHWSDEAIRPPSVAFPNKSNDCQLIFLIGAKCYQEFFAALAH